MKIDILTLSRLIIGTFCKPKFGNLDGNGPRPGERCETKWPIFGKIHPNVRLEGPGTEQNFRFGSGWPVRAAHMAMCFGEVWDYRTPHQLLLILSLLQLRRHFSGTLTSGWGMPAVGSFRKRTFRYAARVFSFFLRRRR